MCCCQLSRDRPTCYFVLWKMTSTTNFTGYSLVELKSRNAMDARFTAFYLAVKRTNMCIHSKLNYFTSVHDEESLAKVSHNDISIKLYFTESNTSHFLVLISMKYIACVHWKPFLTFVVNSNWLLDDVQFLTIGYFKRKKIDAFHQSRFVFYIFVVGNVQCARHCVLPLGPDMHIQYWVQDIVWPLKSTHGLDKRKS